MDKRRGTRGGFALPVAVFALVIVGVLVTGGFYMARQETRIGVASQNASDAFYLAETGLYATLANWQNSTMASIGAWNVDTLTGASSTGTWSVAVMPLTNRLYFLEATGTVTKGGALWSGATRKVGVIARVATATMEPPAALSTQGSLQIGGSSQIQGNDTDPSGWSGICDPGSTDKPGILIDDSTNISYAGSTYSIDGSPKITEDSTLTSETLLDFGDYTWSDITSMAEKVFSSSITINNTAPDSALVVSTGTWACHTTNLYNWGDPDNPNAVCGKYFPIIWAKGDLKINSAASGQGILLVEGDLEVQGGYTFYGPVYVKGRFRTAGTGGHFTGGVVAANVELNTTTVLGDAIVTFSSCAVEQAVLNNQALARAKPLAQRSWVDLSNVSY